MVMGLRSHRKLSVVVGRFQIDEPHEGHFTLLNHAREAGERLLIVLGTGPLPTSKRKPLPFTTRAGILKKYYPDAIIEELHDNYSDLAWSNHLDSIIHKTYVEAFNAFPGSEVVTLFHSRDSFAPYYYGIYNTKEIEAADLGVSATLHRERIGKWAESNSEFARGIIWANENHFPTVYSAVDAVIERNINASTEILLITKRERVGFLFPGGFADPDSLSDEKDVAREVMEECGIDVSAKSLTYIGSRNVDDWRYSGEEDVIRSRLFVGSSDSQQEPVAGDDAFTAQFVPLSELNIQDFNECHRPLFNTYLTWKENQ